MKREARSYSVEFKQKAVELTYARGSIVDVCRELDIPRSVLGRWRKESKEYGDNGFPGKGNPGESGHRTSRVAEVENGQQRRLPVGQRAEEGDAREAGADHKGTAAPLRQGRHAGAPLPGAVPGSPAKRGRGRKGPGRA